MLQLPYASESVTPIVRRSCGCCALGQCSVALTTAAASATPRSPSPHYKQQSQAGWPLAGWLAGWLAGCDRPPTQERGRGRVGGERESTERERGEREREEQRERENRERESTERESTERERAQRERAQRERESCEGTSASSGAAVDLRPLTTAYSYSM